MKNLTAIIVDDEQKNVDLLFHFIQKYIPEVHVLDRCLTYKEALHSIINIQPQLVFLDILLDEKNAFDLLKEVGHLDFQIIFTTAYDEYALKAFQYNTVDYLLKPIVIEDLRKTIDRVIKKRNDKIELGPEQLHSLSQSLLGRHPTNLVLIAGMERVDSLDPNDIVYCKSSGRYTEFYLVDKKRTIISSKTLGQYERSLDPVYFYRIHNTYLINLLHLNNINKKAGNYCEISNGDFLPISRRRYEALIKSLR